MAHRLPLVFTKHRQAVVDLAADFTLPLGRRHPVPGLAGPAVVTITRRTSGAQVDVTQDFDVANVTVDTPFVRFRLGAGDPAAGSTPANQDGGQYTLRIDCPATNGETLVSTHTLLVDEDGDAEAPSS